MTKHPLKIAAEMSHSPKLAAKASGLTVNQVRAIREKQAARRAIRQQRDPLLDAAATRRWRTASARRAAAADTAARLAALQADIDRDRARRERQEATRSSLLLAARAARQLGFKVCASKRGGTVSSYYCRRDNLTLRISDHDIPETPQRFFVAQMHGRDSYDGYHGRQLIVDQPRRYEWLKRAIVLAAAGRM